MRSPLEFGDFLELDEVGSTQDFLIDKIRSGEKRPPGVVLARHQLSGRGRRERAWQSGPGDSLTMSMRMAGQADANMPWLVGMAVAVCAAEALRLQVQWPNDLCWNGRKVGGILTEISMSPDGRSIPVVGVGINLNQSSFKGDIASSAASLFQRDGRMRDPRVTAEDLIAKIESFPEPVSWEAIAVHWNNVDTTPGKVYVDSQGRKVVAREVGRQGSLMAICNGDLVEIVAADALR